MMGSSLNRRSSADRKRENLLPRFIVPLVYISIGVVLVAGSFAMGWEGWERLILPVVGVGSIATGACGW